MPGPISTNAPFTEFGNSMILRDIEQLYLLVGQISGDLGNQKVKTSDTSGNSPTTTATKPTTSLGAFISTVRAAAITVSSSSSAFFTSFSSPFNGVGVSYTPSGITVPAGQYVIDVFSNGTVSQNVYTPLVGWQVVLYVNGVTDATYGISKSRFAIDASGAGYIEFTTTATISTFSVLSSSDLVTVQIINTGNHNVTASCTVKFTKVG